jgi:hypothetical protein
VDAVALIARVPLIGPGARGVPKAGRLAADCADPVARARMRNPVVVLQQRARRRQRLGEVASARIVLHRGPEVLLETAVLEHDVPHVLHRGSAVGRSGGDSSWSRAAEVVGDPAVGLVSGFGGSLRGHARRNTAVNARAAAVINDNRRLFTPLCLAERTPSRSRLPPKYRRI